jgi:hypothetical protein
MDTIVNYSLTDRLGSVLVFAGDHTAIAPRTAAGGLILSG